MITIWCTSQAGLVDEAFIMYLLALTSRNEQCTSNKILRYFDEDTPNIIRYNVASHDIMDNIEAIQKWFTETYFSKYIYDVEVQYGKWEITA